MSAEPEHIELPPGRSYSAIITLSNGNDSISQKYEIEQPIITVVTDADGRASIDLGKATPCWKWESVADNFTGGQTCLAHSINPSVGDWVYYYSCEGVYTDSIASPALVTHVEDPSNSESPIRLIVYTAEGAFIKPDVKYGTPPGCWGWEYHHVQP